MAATALLLLAPSKSAASSNAPPIVVTASSAVAATGLAGDESEVAVDACGDIYAVQQYGGEVDRIPSGGGTATVVVAAGGANYAPAVLFMDASRSNLYVEQATSGAIKIPIVNCVPQTSSETSIGLGVLPVSSNGWGYLTWYFSASAVAADSAGNVFIATDVACCDTVNNMVVIYASGGYSSGAYVLGAASGLSYPINSIAVDLNNNLYLVMGCNAAENSSSPPPPGCSSTLSGTLYKLAIVKQATSSAPAVYSSTPVAYGSGYSSNVTGVTVDSAGNLYVADAGNSAIYEIPYETSGSTSALNPADQFVVATNVTPSNPVATDGAGDFYYGLSGASVYELSRGSAKLGSVLATSNVNLTTVGVAFNASTTPKTFSVISGDGNIANKGTGTCTAKTYAAGSSCTVIVSFGPQYPGTDRAALELLDASNNVLSTAYLSGTGVGPAPTLDPGTVAASPATFKTPESSALDAAGDLFVADAGASAVYEIKSGSTTAVSIGTGLSSPAGVAVDGAGDVFIADTGHNQIVEVPVISGVLNNADQITLVSSTTSIAGSDLNAPAGVTVDAQGNLIIADTGNNRIVYLPYDGSWNLASAFAVSTGLTAPLATTVDPSGNLYIANSGTGQIDQLLAPFSIGTLQLVAVGFGNPSGLATDASGSLFVADYVNGDVVRIPNLSGSLEPNDEVEVGIGVSTPYGVVTDASGNLYVTNGSGATAYKITRTGTTLSFGDWATSTSSGVLPALLGDAGNQQLALGSPYYTASGNTGDFSIATTGSGICAANGTVAAGASCEIDATFTPTTTGTRTDTLTLTGTLLNPFTATLKLTGTGTAAVATKTVLALTSPSSGSPSFGESLTLSATVTATSGTPSGTATLIVDGVETATATLNSSGVATFNLDSGLTGGSHTLIAVYNGTTSFNGSVSAALQLSVTKAATATALALTTPYTNPLSAVSGTSVTFTAVVGFSGVGIPTGTVTFSSGGTTLGTTSLVPAAGGLFSATFSTSSLAVGNYNVVATYSGDPNYIGSASAASATLYIVSAPYVTVTSLLPSITTGSGGSTTITYTATSYGGWYGLVGFGCLSSSLPANTRCVFSPGQLEVLPSTPSASTYNPTVTLSVLADQPPLTTTASKFLWWLAGPAGLLLFFVRRRLARRAWATMTTTLAFVLLTIAAGGMGACTSGLHYSTPQGTTQITVYAWSDPYSAMPSTGTTNPSTETCGAVPGSNPVKYSTALAPCSQTTFQVSLTVE
jgi:sugar lactone lactonase YvrE